MGQVMDGEASPVQLAGFLVALRAKGETVDELDGLASGDARATPSGSRCPGECVDVVGTGGDRAHTVNISTMAALVVAGAGHRVVKHGNRAASSSCGSADVLEALGVRLDLPPRAGGRAGRGGRHHVLLRAALPPGVPARRAGPGRTRRADRVQLPRPADQPGPARRPPRSASPTGGWRRWWPGCWPKRGRSALVFRGEDGLDELTISGPSRVWAVAAGTVTEHLLDPAELGIPRSDVAALRGADAAYNSSVARALFAGQDGPVRDAVLLNAAAALVAAGVGDPGGSLVARMGTALILAGAQHRRRRRRRTCWSAGSPPPASRLAQASSRPSANAASRSCWE